MRSYLIASIILTTSLAAQTPPADQEKSLRARVEQFYKSMQDGKFRVAYGMVADDSQEIFMEMAKPKFGEWSIQTIDWSDEFRKAKVTLDVATELRFSGQVVPVKRPLESLWRQEEGEWLWYYIKPKEVRTPFGVVPVDPKVVRKSVDIKEKLATAPKPEDIMRGVEFNTPNITFKKAEKGEAEIKVKNGLPGHITVELQLPEVPGLSAEKLKVNAAPQQEVSIKILWNPQNAELPTKVFQGTVFAMPIGGSQIFAIKWSD